MIAVHARFCIKQPLDELFQASIALVGAFHAAICAFDDAGNIRSAEVATPQEK